MSDRLQRLWSLLTEQYFTTESLIAIIIAIGVLLLIAALASRERWQAGFGLALIIMGGIFIWARYTQADILVVIIWLVAITAIIAGGIMLGLRERRRPPAS